MDVRAGSIKNLQSHSSSLIPHTRSLSPRLFSTSFSGAYSSRLGCGSLICSWRAYLAASLIVEGDVVPAHVLEAAEAGVVTMEMIRHRHMTHDPRDRHTASHEAHHAQVPPLSAALKVGGLASGLVLPLAPQPHMRQIELVAAEQKNKQGSKTGVGLIGAATQILKPVRAGTMQGRGPHTHQEPQITASHLLGFQAAHTTRVLGLVRHKEDDR